MKKKFLPINRLIFISSLVGLLLIFSTFLNTFFLTNKVYGYSRSNNQYIMVTVKEGDTLWTLAKNNNKSNRDIRKIVHEIKDINNLHYMIIYPGDLIKVPIY